MASKCAWHISKFKLDIAELAATKLVLVSLLFWLCFCGNSNSRIFFAPPSIWYRVLFNILFRIFRYSPQSHLDWQSTIQGTRRMFNNPDMSDISFTCKGSEKTFYAHKYVLGTSSAVFRTMFFGDLAEKNSVLHLIDTDEEGLEQLLWFLYTGELTLTGGNILSVTSLSKKYVIPFLTRKCVEVLKCMVCEENVLTILEWAIYFDEKSLEMECWEVLNKYFDEIATFESFKRISKNLLASILKVKRKCFFITKVILCRAVSKWVDFQCSQRGLDLTKENRRSVIGDAIHDLRFMAMDVMEVVKNVKTSGVLPPEEIIPILQYRKHMLCDSIWLTLV